MSENRWRIGSQVYLRFEFFDLDGIPKNPTSVVCTVQDPAGTDTTPSATAAATTLAAGIDADDPSLTVAVGTGQHFPNKDFRVTIGSETIAVGERDEDTFSGLTRGAAGTTPASHLAAAAVTAIGVFNASVTTNLAGRWRYRGAGTGAVVAADERAFSVLATSV